MQWVNCFSTVRLSSTKVAGVLDFFTPMMEGVSHAGAVRAPVRVGGPLAQRFQADVFGRRCHLQAHRRRAAARSTATDGLDIAGSATDSLQWGPAKGMFRG